MGLLKTVFEVNLGLFGGSAPSDSTSPIVRIGFFTKFHLITRSPPDTNQFKRKLEC